MGLFTVLASTAAAALLGFVTGVSVAASLARPYSVPPNRVVWGLLGALLFGTVSGAWFFHFRNAGGKGGAETR